NKATSRTFLVLNEIELRISSHNFVTESHTRGNLQSGSWRRPRRGNGHPGRSSRTRFSEIAQRRPQCCGLAGLKDSGISISGISILISGLEPFSESVMLDFDGDQSRNRST
ncbi:hypothetical protein BVRB_019700, partial [Beta vulgaris subsp. vulgaris]